MAVAVVIGGGHNGMTCALLLAKRGVTVELFEAAPCLGGACVTKRLPCGCKINEAANAFGMVPQELLDSLGFYDFGQQVIIPNPQLVLLNDGQSSVSLYTTLEQTIANLPNSLICESEAFTAFTRDLTLAGQTLAPFLLDSTASFSSALSAMEEAQPQLGRLLIGSIRSVLDESFQTDVMKSLCVAGAPLYPALTSQSGTAFALVYAAQSSNRGIGGWGIVRGGIGRFTDQLASGLADLGVKVHLGCPVDRISVNKGVVTGVETRERFVPADVVVAATNPVLTMTHLFALGDLDVNLRKAIGLKSSQGGCAKLNVLLDKPLSHWTDRWPHLDGRSNALFVYCPSLDFLDSAYADFLNGRPSANPYFEMTFQGGETQEMTCGNHTPVSIFFLYVPHSASRDGSTSRDQVERAIRGQVEHLFPGFNEHVLSADLLLPEDIESNYGMLLGNVDHGSMTLDNLFENRPLPRDIWDTYRPQRFILGNAGRHPGGLVTAIPGYLAHLEALKELND